MALRPWAARRQDRDAGRRSRRDVPLLHSRVARHRWGGCQALQERRFHPVQRSRCGWGAWDADPRQTGQPLREGLRWCAADSCLDQRLCCGRRWAGRGEEDRRRRFPCWPAAELLPPEALCKPDEARSEARSCAARAAQQWAMACACALWCGARATARAQRRMQARQRRQELPFWAQRPAFRPPEESQSKENQPLPRPWRRRRAPWEPRLRQRQQLQKPQSAVRLPTRQRVAELRGERAQRAV